jgi:hypothetical protein
MKQVHIGDVAFSKVILGSNPFYGHSHFSDARDAEYVARFDDERVRRVAQRGVDLGINTLESSANERIVALLAELRGQNHEALHFIGSTRIDETSEMKSHPDKLAFLIANRADICVIHAQYVDRPSKDGRLGNLEQMVDTIHAAGLLAGISTHQVQTIELCENRACGIDAYLFPVNSIGFAYPGYKGQETVQDRVDIVRGVAKPFILIKVLAAGRIPPSEALPFAAEIMKPNDLISLGFGAEDEVAEAVGLLETLF